MSTSRPNFARRATLIVASLALPVALAGCSAPTALPPPPSGGQSLVLDFTSFQQTVEPILVRHGCDADGDCHGGGIRGALQLSPPTAKNARFDFDQVVLEVSVAQPDSSPILLKPLALAAGGVPHAFKPFASTADSDFQAMRAWVRAGVVR